MKRPVFIILIISLLTVNTYAITFENNTILNTSISNSSITFSFKVEVTNVTIEPNYVYLQGITFDNITGNFTCNDVNQTTQNSNIDSSEFICSNQNVKVTIQSHSRSGQITNQIINTSNLSNNSKKDIIIKDNEITSNEIIYGKNETNTRININEEIKDNLQNSSNSCDKQNSNLTKFNSCFSPFQTCWWYLILIILTLIWIYFEIKNEKKNNS